ncbi:uncharacterized protein LOC131043284 [Cryptomeria japonica]|uniref:uncharacterized protein LOC131043284 n=1 Tax=Cryptomeria japonica TaxID=3369 RepID=UPI0027DAAEF5|nr:uncharacterized protein LOC131043284 [Cryptomeria japonica]
MACATRGGTSRGGGRKRDPMWKHVTPGAVAGEVICNHCTKIMTGGIYRLKIHLAQISGQNITVSNNCPEEVQREAKARLSEFKQKKVEKKRTAEAMAAPLWNITSTESEKFWGGQQYICIIESPYWEQMVSGLTNSGKGFKSPSRYELSGPLLQDEVQNTHQLVEQQRRNWERNGCTILSDGWTDSRNRTLINFLVASGGQVVFLKSIDASDQVKNAKTLCNTLDEVVTEVGVQNVVQVVTDNAAACVAACKLLQARHPSLFWSPCAAHCLDLLLEDIGKLRVTRFAMNFLNLQSILHALPNLKRMFVSERWLQSPYCRKPEAENVVKALSEPLVRVLQMVDGDKSPIGYLYEAMGKAKEAIQHLYGSERTKYEPIWRIIDRRWNRQLHQHIHVAAYYLNPKFFYSRSFKIDQEVQLGLDTYIQRLVLDENIQDFIVDELQRLTQKHLNDLVYVRYDLRLHEKRVQGNNSYDALDIDEIDPYTADWIAKPDVATGDIDVDAFITDAQLDEMEREAAEWAAKVAEREEAGDEFVDPEEADSSPVEDIAAATAAAATPSTSAPTQRQQSFLSFSRKRNL